MQNTATATDCLAHGPRLSRPSRHHSYQRCLAYFGGLGVVRGINELRVGSPAPRSSQSLSLCSRTLPFHSPLPFSPTLSAFAFLSVFLFRSSFSLPCSSLSMSNFSQIILLPLSRYLSRSLPPSLGSLSHAVYRCLYLPPPLHLYASRYPVSRPLTRLSLSIPLVSPLCLALPSVGHFTCRSVCTPGHTPSNTKNKST